MQHLFLDCSHGMSGDMTLASLAHLGVDLSPLPGLLAQAGVACRLEVWREERGGGPGCRVEVSWEAEGQPLRHPADIAAIFAAVPVADRVRERALAVLEALTLAEAEAHGIAPEEVHFHEVGAVDTLVDILGARWALDRLGVGDGLCAALVRGQHHLRPRRDPPARARHGQSHARPARTSHRCEDGAGDPHRRGPGPCTGG